MMANSARDPYVLASVRREMIDHPSRRRDIEDECAACHMPAAQQIAHAAGGRGGLRAGRARNGARALDAWRRDGVSCTVCHQIAAERLGTPRELQRQLRRRAAARQRTAPRLRPVRAGCRPPPHHALGDGLRAGAVGAHTAIRALRDLPHARHVARGPDGAIIGSLPEQMNYQEWRHSAFFGERRWCQSCHMPRADGPVRVASVLGDDRPTLARHTFLGGNAFMLRLMNRFRDELGMEATPAELEATAQATVRQLEAGYRHRQHRAGRHGRRHAGARRRRAQPDRPQVSDRLSVAPRLAPRDRARPPGPHGVRVGPGERRPD